MLPPIKLSSPATREFWEIPVLFEDEHLLALDKPARLLTSPDRYDPFRPNLMKLLHAGVSDSKPWAKERGLAYLSNAHRLDFETSGIILLAKTKPVLVALANLFSAEKPLKRYVTLVKGDPAEDQFEVDAPLGPHPGRPGFVRVDRKNGKRAHTKFTVLERFGRFSLIQCEPLTGRTHQIRVHIREAGLKIAGDELYGGRPMFLSVIKPNYRLKSGRTERPLISRVALHAEQLILEHPVTHATVSIQSPWPKDITVAVKYLRRYSGSGGGAEEPESEPDSEIV